VTMFVAFLDPRTGVLTYASAGHHPALLARADGRQEWLKVEGLPIGVDHQRGIRASLREAKVTLAPGDLVLQTTDGVHEAEGGPAGEAFGFERVAATVGPRAARGAQAVIEGLAEAVESWRGGGAPDDDETLVVLSCGAPSLAEGPDDPTVALERVAEARHRGVALKVPATIEALVRLDDWIARLPDFLGMPGPDRARVIFVLHELCSNIVEHGHPDGQGPPISVWWLPEAGAAAAASGAAVAGQFVIVDQGAPFSADNVGAPDYGDPTVRRRGRGFGIDLIRRTGVRLTHHPRTPAGNLTLVSLPAAGPESMLEDAG